MSSGAMRSFCTPDGAMTMRSCWARMLMPPPVPDTHPCTLADADQDCLLCIAWWQKSKLLDAQWHAVLWAQGAA